MDGRRKGRTFDTEKEAVYWAAGIKARAKEAEKSPLSLTVTAAVDRYIESKDAVLSPSTIKGYRQVKGNLMGGIALVKIEDLTQENVQQWVNGLAREKSPKTVSNAHGLLSAVLKEYRPSMALRTTLPQKVKTNIQIPSEAELRAILAAARGTKYEIPIVLAVWMGLRQSEILGLTWDCVDGDTLHHPAGHRHGRERPRGEGDQDLQRDPCAPSAGVSEASAGGGAAQRTAYCANVGESNLQRFFPHL